MPTPHHRALRQRPVFLSVLLALLGALVLTLASPGGPPTASAATPVPKTACKRFDPNLVNGICLRYRGKTGSGYTWIGSYRADNGQVFFCIDYLYDSRFVAHAAVVGTQSLQNQFGARIGETEVAALNYVISTWAPHGTTGSNQTDAAIALIIREVMSDSIRPDGTVVYRPGLKVGGTVAAPVGGLPGRMLAVARSMWAKASQYRGPSRLVLAGGAKGRIELGESATYRVAVVSAGDHLIPDLRVTFRCTGPIACPRPVTTRTTPVYVQVTPRALGTASVEARTSSPAADGKLLKLPTWRTHGGRAAQDHGVQRGWIGQRNSTRAEARVETRVIKGTPTVTTRTSAAVATPGAMLTDLVTVAGLPKGSHQQVTATLFGPFAQPPGPTSCTEAVAAGHVTLPVDHDGTFTTPPLAVDGPGYYVWTEAMPGDDLTNPLSTPCGITSETTLVKTPQLTRSTPWVHTVASAQHLEVGAALHDLVVVGGLADGSSVEVRWSLLGPVAPRHGACTGLDWSHAPVLAHGRFTADHNGSYSTPPVRVGAPGCTTFVERVPQTATNQAVSTSPGQPTETVLVTRPPVPVVPEIPSGPARAGR